MAQGLTIKSIQGNGLPVSSWPTLNAGDIYNAGFVTTNSVGNSALTGTAASYFSANTLQ